MQIMKPVELDALICRELASIELWMVKRLKFHGMHQRIIGNKNNIFTHFFVWYVVIYCRWLLLLSLS